MRRRMSAVWVLVALATRAAAVPPTLEDSYLFFNHWEPLKRAGAEQFRLAEADLAWHAPLIALERAAGSAGERDTWPLWLTVRAAARMMDLPGAPIVTPTLAPALRAGWFREAGDGGWLAGAEARLTRVTNAQTGPTLTPASELGRPGVGRFNEIDGRFATDHWRVTLVARRRAGTGPAAASLTLFQSFQREFPGDLTPGLRGWYPLSRETTELRWDRPGPAWRLLARGLFEVRFEGSYASLRRHYANSLVEAAAFPRTIGWLGERTGLFARFQWGFDDTNILFTTKVHELVAGLVWAPARAAVP